MPPLTNMLISASAGTGKTYQLSLRFLGLLALNSGNHPERLIAITFTRKAAGEFKDRILTDLAAGATDEAGAARLKERLWAVIKGTDGEPGLWPGAPEAWKEENLHRERFLHLLHILAQNLARLNLCTIDSLFAQIASASTFELGVSGFSMIDPTAEKLARREALLSLYRECAVNGERRRDFEDAFLSGADSDAEAADAEDSMTRRLNAYHELFLDVPDAGMWGNPVTLGFTPEELMPPVSLEQFDSVLHDLLEQARATPIPEKKKEANTRENFISYLESFKTYTFLGKVCFHSKRGSRTEITIEKARAKFAEYWSPLLEELIQSWMRMETLHALRRTRATHNLMLLFERKYSSLVRDRGKFLFHDVTRMLGGGAITPELKRDLQYRMYCRYDHWMLDEFQDTSQTQWHVIKPFLDDLAESKTGNEGSIFVVGDIKQSVYQWRGGDPELFRSVSSQLQLEQRGMSTSYRSVQPVLDLVNDICDYARTAPGCEPAALEQWGEYPAHRCAPHLEDRPGTSQIWQAPKAENVSANNDLVCQTAADILERTGALRRGLETAILVSTKNQALVIKGWLTDHGIPAEVCDDVPVGVDSPLGKNLLYFFRWLLMPGDPFVIGLLTHSPLRPLITQGGPESMGWKEWRLLLERDGYAAVMEELEQCLLRGGAELTDFHRDRLAVWQNEAEQVDEQGVSLDEWIRRMEDLTRREDPAAGIVRIMTIHKSKGLGFDIVILPQIGRDTPFADGRHLTHFIKKNGEGGVEGIVLAPSRHVYMNTPQFRELYGEWRARQQFDGFCKLYVALTRAKRATYVILPYREAKEETEADSMWKVVRSSIRPLNRGTEDILPESGASCLYSRGLDGWYEEFPESIQKRAEENALEWPPQKPLARERISPSGLSEEASPLQGEKHAGAGKAAALGSAVHAVFERITRWDDENKPAWALHPATEAERIVAECMEIPSIRELFTLPETARIMKEQRIEAIDGNNWISGIIDRLILDGGGARIVDFKTDHADTPGQLRERHANQLNAYARIVSRITGIPLERITRTIVSTCLKETVPIQ